MTSTAHEYSDLYSSGDQRRDTVDRRCCFVSETGEREVIHERFEKLAQKQKDGLITVADCCRELGISRSTWYDRVRKVG